MMDLVQEGRGALLAVLAALVVFVAVSPAGAQDPVPQACTSSVITDPADDDVVTNVPVTVDPTADRGVNPALDIIKAWVGTRAGTDGKAVTSAYIQVKNLDDKIPSQAREGEVSYLFDFALTNGVTWLKAFHKGSNWVYYWGKVAPAPGGAVNMPTSYEPTTGKAFPGPNGVVQIDFPAEAGLTAGKKLTGAYTQANTTGQQWEKATGVTLFADRGPDGSEVKELFVMECASAAPTAEPTASPTPEPSATPTPEPQPQQQQQQGQQQPPAQQPAARQDLRALPIKVAASRGRLRGRKVVKLRITASQRVTDLVLQLKKGRKVLGTLRAKSLSGTSTFKLGVGSRKVKAGRYRIEAIGLVDGRSLRYSQAVKLRK